MSNYRDCVKVKGQIWCYFQYCDVRTLEGTIWTSHIDVMLIDLIAPTPKISK